MAHKKPGKIILLNGTSSSGKSTLLNELKKLYPSAKIFKVDDFFPSDLIKKANELGWNQELGSDPWTFLHVYLANKTGRPFFDTELRKELFTNIPIFYHYAQQAAMQGHDVFIDTVLERESEYEQFASFFKNNKVIKILVYCPLDILLQRVQMRNKAGIPEETRTAFLSFEQFPAIYKIQDDPNEPSVDQIQSSIIKVSLYMAIQELIDNHISVAYFPKLEEFKYNFIWQFKLDQQEELTLVAKHRYDLILNSKLNTAQENAKLIKQYICETLKENS